MNCIVWAEPVAEPDPKVMMEIDGEPWIIKFPAHVDRADIGKNGIRLLSVCRAVWNYDE